MKTHQKHWFNRMVSMPVFPLIVITIGISIFFIASEKYDVSSRQYAIFVPRNEKTNFDINKKIYEGISLLKASPPLIYETKRGRPLELDKKQVALAIFDKKSGKVFERRVWVSEGSIERAKEGESVELIPVDEGDDFTIKVGWWNSFNTVYEISDNPNLIVVANRYLVLRSYLPENKNLKLIEGGPASRYAEIVYAPYSEQIHWQEVIDAGKEYIGENLTLAIKDLRERKIESRFSPGLLVADAVNPQLVQNILIVEHIDPDLLRVADDNGRRLAERVLVIVGANREWAYRYTGSSAGASGIAQFIESTYELTIDQYPDAGLIEDYTLGMADHANAMKAMILFLDSHADFLKNGITHKDVLKDGITEEMLAAVYNGGPGRVVQSVNRLGARWKESKTFPKETAQYVSKYSTIRSLNLFIE